MAWPTRLLCGACLIVLQSLVLASSYQPELHVIQALAEPIFITAEMKQMMTVMFASQTNNVSFGFDDSTSACLLKAVNLGILDLWQTILSPSRGSQEQLAPNSGLPSGVVVTDCNSACRLAPRIYGAFGVPSLALGCSSEQFNDRRAFPNLIRIMSPFSSLKEPILQFMNHFGWKSLAILSTVEDDINLSAQAIKTYLESKSISVVQYTIMQPKSPDNEIHKIAKKIQNEYERSKYQTADDEDYLCSDVLTAGNLSTGPYLLI